MKLLEMTYFYRKSIVMSNTYLLRFQLDKVSSYFKQILQLMKDNESQVKNLRKAMGLSSSELGAKAGISQGRIIQIEKAELTGEVKISTLKQVGASMGLKLVYGFVPETSYEDLLNCEAEKKVNQRINQVDHLMMLHKKKLSDDEKELLKSKYVMEYLAKPRQIWSN